MTIITTNTSTPLNFTGLDYTILEGVTHYNDSFAPTVDINNSVNALTDILILGTVLAINDNAIEELTTGAGDLGIFVASSGSIVANRSAVFSENDDTTVQNDGSISGTLTLVGSDARIINSGTIVDDNPNTSIYMNGGGALEVINTGTITTAGRAINTASSTGIAAQITINNSGDIVAGGNAITVSGSDHSLTLVNSGLIQSGGSDFYAIYNNANTSTVTNTGEIIGDISLLDGPSNILTNHGTITGEIRLSSSADMITNSGEISGNISMGNGNDTFDGRGGTINGYVDGGSGDDTFIIDDGTIWLFEFSNNGTDTVQTTASYALADNFENLELNGSDNISGAGNGEDNTLTGNTGDNGLYGLGGADIIFGGAGDDMIRGGRGDDTLYGDGGDDYITGGTSNDRLFGGDGADILEGRRGEDRLFGNDGDDILSGAQGKDRLTGGNGDDVLIGGAGEDVLIGGDGIDTFVWNAAAESTDNSDADRISDFETGIDLMDFRNAMQGDFDINIGGSLTGGGTASIYTDETGGNTEVFADVDGDGSADMRVDITGVLGVTEVDFIV